MRLLILALQAWARVASACSCSALTECDFARWPVVFIGKVSGAVEPLSDRAGQRDSKSVRFEVIEAFRGLAPGTKFVDVEIMTFAMCDPNPYWPGRTYLVAPLAQDRGFSDGACFSGRFVEDAGEAIEYLRRHPKTPWPFQIRGQVGAVHRGEPDFVKAMLWSGEAKPLQGVKVSTSALGQSFNATTDARGQYELTVPGPGRYPVRATSPPHAAADAWAEVPRAGPCAVTDIGLLSHSSISGRVLDRAGRPLRRAMAGLIDLNRPPDQKMNRVWFRTAYPEQPDGSFLFENVPIGRYLLAFNPDGPQAEGGQPYRQESTFYPNGAKRAQAQTIEIAAGGMRLVGRDLIVGPPVTFRAVTVKVRLSDGSPMAYPVVEIIGEPLDAGGIPWRPGGHMMRNQEETRFQVPTNRKFRIRVRDGYGRDLKKTYESTHTPGSTPVVQEFIVAAR